MARSPVVVMIAIALVLGGCSSRKRQKRTGDAAPVELIPTPNTGSGKAGKGPTSEEQEPNEGEDVATPLALGASVVGKISPETDVDHYRIDVTAAGALSIELPGIESPDLMLELLDAQGTVLARSDRTPAKTREGIPNFGVSPGRYTAVV
ncbi:MAG TPA: PPC domain-containing protein, partial [Kofleriaceae bacterium]